MSDFLAIPKQPPLVRSLRFRALPFAVTLLVATILYLVTGMVAIAVILPCLHAGWKTLRTGLWILASDPCRFRARTCFAFYLAAACWKAAAAALISVAVFLAAANNFVWQPDMKAFAATMLVLAAGVGLNTILGIGAICAALAGELRVWIHPRLQSMVHGNFREVHCLNWRRSGVNHAIFVVGTALVFPAVAVGMICCAALTSNMNVGDVETTPMLALTFASVFGPPLAAIPCYAWLSSRIIARAPGECWPIESFGDTKNWIS